MILLLFYAELHYDAEMLPLMMMMPDYAADSAMLMLLSAIADELLYLYFS